MPPVRSCRGCPLSGCSTLSLGRHDRILLVGADSHHVAHVAVLALGGVGDVGRTLGLEFGIRGRPALLAVGGEHELGEGALDVEVGVGRVQSPSAAAASGSAPRLASTGLETSWQVAQKYLLLW